MDSGRAAVAPAHRARVEGVEDLRQGGPGGGVHVVEEDDAAAPQQHQGEHPARDQAGVLRGLPVLRVDVPEHHAHALALQLLDLGGGALPVGRAEPAQLRAGRLQPGELPVPRGQLAGHQRRGDVALVRHAVGGEALIVVEPFDGLARVHRGADGEEDGVLRALVHQGHHAIGLPRGAGGAVVEGEQEAAVREGLAELLALGHGEDLAGDPLGEQGQPEQLPRVLRVESARLLAPRGVVRGQRVQGARGERGQLLPRQGRAGGTQQRALLAARHGVMEVRQQHRLAPGAPALHLRVVTGLGQGLHEGEQLGAGGEIELRGGGDGLRPGLPGGPGSRGFRSGRHQQRCDEEGVHGQFRCLPCTRRMESA